MDRAYCTLEIKSFDEARRTFKGIASTPNTDRDGDIMEPLGASFDLPMPFLWQHNSAQPIGWITAARPTPRGIEVDGEVHNEREPGLLKDRLDEAWQTMRAKLVRALSIGWRPIEAAAIKGTSGLHVFKWKWLELSAVTIPANQDATITAIKSIDDRLLAASGRGQSESRPGATSPGVPGKPNFGRLRLNFLKGTGMKTLQELIEARTTKSARLTELVESRKNSESGRFSTEEATEFDGLNAEVEELDDDIRIKRFEQQQAASARPARGGSSEEGSQSRGTTILVRKEDPEDKFKGQSYVRFLIAKAAAFVALRDGNYISPVDIAAHRWGKSHPKLVQYIKAAVAGGGTGSGEWGAELAAADTRFTGDFVDFLYGMTVFDRLPLRSIPSRVHVKGQDGAATGYWVGESKAIPVTKPDFSDVELSPLKVGAIAVASKELIGSSSPSAEMLIRDSIAEASAQRVDTTFLSATAASAGVSPAGILNGVTALAPSGADAAAVRADMMSLYSSFLTAKNASGLIQIMTPSMAKALALLVNALGQPEFVGLNANGGTLLGDPVFTGDNVTPGDWILMKPSDIWKIGDGGVQVSMSDTATIEQNDAPAGASDTPVDMASHRVSMFQTESVAFKVVRAINYAKRRTGAVAVLSNAEYGGVVS